MRSEFPSSNAAAAEDNGCWGELDKSFNNCDWSWRILLVYTTFWRALEDAEFDEELIKFVPQFDEELFVTVVEHEFSSSISDASACCWTNFTKGSFWNWVAFGYFIIVLLSSRVESTLLSWLLKSNNVTALVDVFVRGYLAVKFVADEFEITPNEFFRLPLNVIASRRLSASSLAGVAT